VTAKFDLNLIPFYRIKGLDRPQYPGLLVSSPPKRAARGRQDDRLVVYLSFSGNIPLSTAEYRQIAEQLAQRFYRNAGSLTAAMRATIESLNQLLVDRNLRTTGKGQYIVGRLILGVLREAQFILAQSGPTHVFHLAAGEARPLRDAQISGRGLGFSQNTPLYFSQAELHPGEVLVLCAQLPSAWETALLSETKPAAEPLRRKLMSLTDEDLNAVLIQVQAGKGSLNILPGTHTAASPAPAGKAPARPQPAAPAQTPPASHRPASQVEGSQPASRFTRILSGTQAEPTPEQAVPAAAAPERQAEGPSSRPGTQARQAAAAAGVRPPAGHAAPVTTAAPRRPNRFITPQHSGDLAEISRPASRNRQQTFRSLAHAMQRMRLVTQRLAQGFQAFLPRILPGLKDETSEASGSSMAFIAIAIPILVVLVASMVYFRLGQPNRYKDFYSQALAAAEKAQGQGDPLEVRHSWETVLYFLGEADKYQKTQDSLVLRQEAQTALDNLDGIVRLDFHPAIISGLSSTIKVSHMAANDTELYLLNAGRGNVLRAFLTNQGYEVDPSFNCAPGQYGDTAVGTLIDIAALPKVNTRNASLLAMDANATLLYCAPDAEPIAVPLAAPELGWRGISGFVLDSDGKDLYVLDPLGNAVWVYAGNFGDFPNLPIMFFGEQIPQNMNTAIDLAANGNDLYLLFRDGHVTSCTLSRLDVVPTRCTDPVTYIDTRPGQQTGTQVSDAVFSQMTFAAPPDPSLYLFEPLTQAIYRFSPRPDSLTLQGQFRATEDQRQKMIGEPATAMTMSPNRYLFLSVGNQVYFATDVP
jgi:hypothetical protein